MGIKGLFPVLAKHVAMPRVAGRELHDLTVGIDYNVMLHRFAKAKVVCDAAANQGFGFGSPAHVDLIVGAMENISELFERAVWVVDSPHKDPAKRHEHERRAQATARTLELATERAAAFQRVLVGDKRTFATLAADHPDLEEVLGKRLGPALATGEITVDVAFEEYGRDEWRREFQRGHIGSALIRAVRDEATARQIESIVSPAGVEAEQLAASLQARGALDAVVSEDTDTLCFGATWVLCKFDGRGFTSLRLPAVLAGLELDMPRFLDLCILAGCDFTEGTLKGVAALTALKLVKEHSDIEAVIEARRPEDSVKLADFEAQLERFDFEAARTKFLQPVDYDEEFINPASGQDDCDFVPDKSAVVLPVARLSSPVNPHSPPQPSRTLTNIVQVETLGHRPPE
jgi:5'-3' exonuclease